MLQKICLLFFGFVTLINASSKCPDIQDLKQHNGHYYGVTTNTMTFDEAKKFAESKGGYLAIPNNAAENSFLKGILGGRKGGWIGVYDSNYSSNYSYSIGQKINSSRFKDIKGKSLTYSYWESTQPDNLIEEYDTYNGQQRVSPLGEHWVAMDGNSGKWWDYGNHFGIGNAKFHALIEFDNAPICFEDLSSNVTDTFTNKKCSTQIWDTKTGNLETGTIFDCRTDTYGNTYCPSALSQCSQEWDYDSGFSVAGVGQVVDYVKKKEVIKTISVDCNCGYYFSCQYGFLYNHFFLPTDKERQNYGYLCLANGGFILNVGYYQCSEGIIPTSKGMTTDNIARPTDMSCKTTIIEKQCPDEYIETTGAETSKGECKKTIEYTYYNYLCNNSKNEQDFNYIAQNSGGNCNKTDSNNLIDNSSNLSQPCNSSNPPTNNCKREKFTCQANKDRPCSFVDNSWQCSPFPCLGGNDVIPEGDIEGANDKNNDGWNENGMCNGQIYIFNGKDRRCRSWDMFFGLAGGGCCDKDKVFMGLIACKENEKLLAKQNKAELCTEIGEYCSKKINLGFAKICIQKSKGNCCFGSKLARFVHEQGRSQLGILWGSGDSPNCRGFTPEEFQKIDFSKIDLTGAFDIPEINQTDLTNKINSTIENFKNMVSSGNN